MQCPRCKSYELVPTELEKGLVAAGCENCSGALLSLINYRYWLYTFGGESSNCSENQKVECEDSKNAKLCPKCSKLMTKYRVGLESANRVELCGHCDEAWLDSGEWQLLKSLDIQNQLPEIFTEAWQRNIRKQQERASLDLHFEKLIGQQDFEKVKNFKKWLDAHKNASDIKHYVSINFN